MHQGYAAIREDGPKILHVFLRIQNPVVSPREFSVPRQSSAVSPEMLGDVAGLQGSLESLRDLLGKLLCGGYACGARVTVVHPWC